MNDKEKHTMTREDRSLLETLDKIVRSEKVHAQILPILERGRTQLARRPNSLMAWEPIALETFGSFPSAIAQAGSLSCAQAPTRGPSAIPTVTNA